MPNAVLNKVYVAIHTKGLGGANIKKGNRYTCVDSFHEKTASGVERDTVVIKGMYLDATSLSKSFFDENFIELEKADQVKTKTLKLTAREASWLKNFFRNHIDEIADLDGGTDYGALMTVDGKIKKL